MTSVAAEPARIDVTVAGDRSTLAFRGDLTLGTTGPLWRGIDALVAGVETPEVALDLAAVERADTSGAALVEHVQLALCQRGRRVEVAHARPQVGALLALIEPRQAEIDEAEPHPDRVGSVEQIGEFALTILRNVRATLEYVGSITRWLLVAVLRPSRVRWRDTTHYMARVGADALGIVALINFLVGVILAFQAASQLRKYGADLYVADAVGLSAVMELAPLMTAIIVAGRSGSAFAAEIGTMKVNEEVDALQTMGLDRTRFLVLPKVLALMLMMPLLVVFADLCAILGGLSIGVFSIELPMATYLGRTVEAIDTLWYPIQGLIKGECYGIVIASVGCLRGLQTARGAQGVGLSATSAVVTSIFLVICVSAVLTVLFQYVTPYVG